MSDDSAPHGATVVITHRVRSGRERDYENWLTRIDPVCRTSPGHLDTQIVRPIPQLTTTYTVIIRFETQETLRAWMESAPRRELVADATPFLETGDAYTIRTGLDFWFAPETAGSKVPVRWKQLLVTWSAIYPLVLATSFLLRPLFESLGIAGNRFLVTLGSTLLVVFLMTYVVMPRYTRFLSRWLYK